MNLSSAAAEATRSRLAARFGELVEPWWLLLPAVVGELATRWDLVVGQPVGRGNTSLVVRCRRGDGRRAILKLTPDALLAAAEASALRSWQDSGRVPLLWGHDPAFGALLLEALPSETPLAELGRTFGLDDVAGLVNALHRAAVPDDVESLASRTTFIFEHWIARHPTRGPAVTDAVPVERLERGYALALGLLADGGRPVLLHGDLHPGNVLDGGPGRGLVAIDPRPCVGDAAVDAVDWVFWGADDPSSWQQRSRELAALTDVDPQRLWAWCAAFAALLAASRVSGDGADEQVTALLELAP